MSDYPKVVFEMEPEQVDKIMVTELKQHIQWFNNDLEKRKSGMGMSIFDQDPVKDVEYIEEYIKAFTTVVEYYGG